MEMMPIITHHFVKNEDLNHHGTLFAGRAASWFVESGLMAVAEYLPAENVVCVNVHGMNFKQPVPLGRTARLTSKVVYAGKTSLITNIDMSVNGTSVVNGFITFANVGPDGHAIPHGIEVKPDNEEDNALHEQAKGLYLKAKSS